MDKQLPDPTSPVFIGFASLEEAVEHRKKYGGRLFVSAEVEQVIWFNSRMTPSAIFQHPIQRGLSGSLN